MQYIVLVGRLSCPEACFMASPLPEQIIRYLNEGWKLVGGISIDHHNGSYVQAMMKDG